MLSFFPIRRCCLLLLIVIFVGVTPHFLIAGRVCNVRKYGAKGDGATKDTVALQAAIDDCAKKGGGIVLMSAGKYLTAPIELKSYIELKLEKGSTLLGSPDHQDYPSRTEFRLPDLEPLVNARDATNVIIDGEGTIDGNGQSWWDEARAIRDHGILGTGHPRPKLILFDHCNHVRIEGITVQNSPMWHIVPYYSDEVTIRNVRIQAPEHAPNTDAIDPFSSSHALIDHVYADVGDDDIAIKSGPINSPGPDDPSRDITIADCTFKHGHGLSIGSEIAGGVQNIRAERIHFEGTDNGIRIKANRDRGNDVSHIVLRDIDMKNVKNALIISEYYPKLLPAEGVSAAPVTRLTPHFHDINIENLSAVGSESAGAIVGLPEAPIKGVTLRHISIGAHTGLTVGYAEVSGENVTVRATEGEPILKLQDAILDLK
ncbi:MAG TPA: glycoside hydrolase family 28 protein [Terracidiphilus sp.]|jgi:polygalacturonase|nr:glycoside hydrolase family 28 protein [Terracidiphilus sp.]